MIVEVFPDPKTLAEAAADRIARAAALAIAARGRFTIALSGGSTPRPTFERLAVRPVDWSKVVVVWGDERCVPPDDDASNYRLAKESLLDRVPIPKDQIHRMEGERDDLGRAARDYEQLLRRVVPADPPGGIPRLDLALQGLGEDGHTASIFPEAVPLARGPELVARVLSAEKGPRLTLTFPVLNAAREVLFLVSGTSKANVVHTLLEEDGGEPPLPAAHVRPRDGTLVWMLDAAAGEGAGETARR